MSHRPPILFPAILSLMLVGGARAEGQLAAVSPFMPVPGSGAAAVTAGAPLEFRGVMDVGDGLKIRIVDPARKGAAAWLKVNERDPSVDFVVKQYDADHDTVTVDFQGRSLTLSQHVAKVASAGVAQNVPGPVPGGVPMPPAITQSVVVNPTPADEQRRLDVVAAEVARRRALREQAAQQASQGVVPPVMQPQPPMPPGQNNQQNPIGLRGAQGGRQQ